MYDEEYYTTICQEETRQADCLAWTLIESLHPTSVIDFGCATGLYLRPFHDCGIDVCGIDNSEIARSMAVIPQDKIMVADLSKPWTFRSYDTALCIETIEHIDPEYEDVVLDNITSTSDILIFSAAVPGQGGEGHVNCRPKKYWVEKLAEFGFTLDRKTTVEITDKLREEPKVMRWLINNLMVFYRDEPEYLYCIHNPQPESDVTVAILSCGRFDLLKKTIDSLMATIGYPVKVIILDDSESVYQHEVIANEYEDRFDIYIRGESRGHAAALDDLLGLVDTEYVFCCEDDWEFLKPGYLQASKEILNERPSVGVIGIVLDQDLRNHGAADKVIVHRTSSGVFYRNHIKWRISESHDWWNGWIGSPNLKRMSDVRKLGKFADSHSEAEFDREVFKKSGMQSVWLEERYAQHIGGGKSVWPEGLLERDWTRPAKEQAHINECPAGHSGSLGPPGKFRFHVLGLAHLPVHKDYSSCAYTQKVLKLSKMLTNNGHEVILYAGEGSEAECTELVEVLSEQDRIKAYGDYDWRSEFFRHDPDDYAYRTFNRNASREILARRSNRDFLLITFGNYQLPISNAVGIPMTVEAGIGYRGVFAKYKVFESYTWMHHIYGLLNQNDGSWYDAVIPNYFNPEDFPAGDRNGDYYLYIGRLIRRKGVEIAAQVTEKLGTKLVIAGQGTLKNEIEGLDIRGSHIEFVGSVGPEKRAELMGNAIATFTPTTYLEPFGGVAVEAQMCGCPVITTDWGAFTETVLPGITGYRCRTFNEFLHAAMLAPLIDSAACREWAIKNYSVERIAKQYEGYFRSLYNLWNPEGWYLRQDSWSPERYEKVYPLSQ